MLTTLIDKLNNFVFNSIYFEALLKLFIGFILSSIIGLERSSWNKPAGYRTHTLVGISSVLVMLCSEYLNIHYPNVDISRLPGQLLTGIGFIGAGTILRDGFHVKGLTTASSLLAVTCIGLTVGAGFYIVAIVTTIIIYLLLSYSYLFSNSLDHFDTFELTVKINNNVSETISEIEKILHKYNVTLKAVNENTKDTNSGRIFTFIAKHNLNKNINKVFVEIAALENVVHVSND